MHSALQWIYAYRYSRFLCLNLFGLGPLYLAIWVFFYIFVPERVDEWGTVARPKFGSLIWIRDTETWHLKHIPGLDPVSVTKFQLRINVSYPTVDTYKYKSKSFVPTIYYTGQLTCILQNRTQRWQQAHALTAISGMVVLPGLHSRRRPYHK